MRVSCQSVVPGRRFSSDTSELALAGAAWVLGGTMHRSGEGRGGGGLDEIAASDAS